MKKGIATPITLVVLMVVFTSLLAATSYMALGTLRGGASERATYQAFTLAESALEAFPLLVQCGENLPSAYTLSVSAGPTLSATYRYPDGQTTASPMGGRIRVRAVAQHGGGKATLEQTFQVRCGITGAVPAALTSRPRIEIGDYSKVIGVDFDSDSGIRKLTVAFRNVNLLSELDPNSRTFNLEVKDATLIPTGSYLRIRTGNDMKSYRVEGKNGNTLTLTPLFQPGPEDIIDRGNLVQIVFYGVKAYNSSTNTLTLNDARGLVVGQRIRVGSYQGVVENVNVATGQVRVSWEGTPPTSIPEGTPLVAQILGAASSRTIDTHGDTGIFHGSAPNSSLVPTSPDDLFLRVFGMSKEEFRRLFPPVPADSFDGNLGWDRWEIKSVSGPLDLTGSRRLCGQGILVVFGELKLGDLCPLREFHGLIYVAGDFDEQGYNPIFIRGAVVVEGVADLEGCGPQEGGDDCVTDIGLRQGEQVRPDMRIEYDPLVLHSLRVMILGLTSVRVSPVSGTWRRL